VQGSLPEDSTRGVIQKLHPVKSEAISCGGSLKVKHNDQDYQGWIEHTGESIFSLQIRGKPGTLFQRKNLNGYLGLH
jgi:hypothetical protein